MGEEQPTDRVIKDLFMGLDEQYEAFELAEELITVNDQTCYVLTGKINGEVVSESLRLLSAAVDTELVSAEEMDMGEFKIPVELYLNEKDGYPVKMMIDIADGYSEHLSAQNVECEIFETEIIFKSFNQNDQITMPDEKAIKEKSKAKQKERISEYDEIMEGTEQAAELGAAWYDMTISLNDSVITIPCTYKELQDTGAKIHSANDSKNEEKIVESKEDMEICYRTPGVDEGVMRIQVYNNSDKENIAKNCIVNEVSAGSTTFEGLKMIFPGNIQLGSSREEVLAAYGEPEQICDNGLHRWEIETADGIKEFTANFEDEKLYLVSLSWEDK